MRGMESDNHERVEIHEGHLHEQEGKYTNEGEETQTWERQMERGTERGKDGV